MTIKNHELCVQICENIESYHYITTNTLMTKMNYGKSDRTPFCKILYGLETVKIITKVGRKRFKWKVADNWRSRLDSATDINSPQPSPEGGGGGTEIDQQLRNDLNDAIQERIDLQAEKRELEQQLKREKQKSEENFKEEKEELKKKIEEAKKTQKVVIELRKNGKKKIVKELVHKQFKKIMELTSARKHVLMIGPAGCGKSYLANQIATHHGLQYGSINCSIGMSEGQLTGRMLITGKGGTFEYHSTPFVDCYEKGGVFLMDEIDAADPNVLIVMNSALANGRCPVSNRTNNPVAKRHKNFIFLAAANTYGKGADRMYVGRNELDEATLDRFRIGMAEIDYDDGMDGPSKRLPQFNIPDEFTALMKDVESLESSLCPNNELRTRFQWYRKKIIENKLERIVSTRFLIDAHDMITDAGWTIEDCENQYFLGWTDDEIRRVRTSL